MKSIRHASHTLRTAISTAIAAAALLAVSGCATVSPPAPVSIAQTIAANPRLSTLSSLIQSAGLTESLAQAGTLTVFAPSNDAFKKVPAATLADLSKDPEKLRGVLGFHVVPTAAIKASAVTPGTVKSLQGANLAVSKAGDFVVVEEALVEQADVMATNGIVHIIDSVLIPPAPRR